MKKVKLMLKSTDDHWVGIAKAQLLGRKIVEVRYLTNEEAEGLGWSRKSVVMVLDDGNIIWPSMDDEGNDAGAYSNQTRHLFQSKVGSYSSGK